MSLVWSELISDHAPLLSLKDKNKTYQQKCHQKFATKRYKNNNLKIIFFIHNLICPPVSHVHLFFGDILVAAAGKESKIEIIQIRKLLEEKNITHKPLQSSRFASSHAWVHCKKAHSFCAIFSSIDRWNTHKT